MKQPVDTIKHVLVLYELAPVGLRDAPFDTGNVTGLIVQHAGNGVFHQLLGILAIGRGHLLEPRFDVGGEMYVHFLQGTRKPGFEATPETGKGQRGIVKMYVHRCARVLRDVSARLSSPTPMY